MDGVHDLGGRQGFGPVDRHDENEPFHAPWEARVLGMVKTMAAFPDWSIDWFRQVREQIEPVDYLTRPYYDQWLQTYAAMLVVSGAVTVEEIVAGKAAGPPATNERPSPMAPEAVAASFAYTARFDRPGPAPRFAPGDAVRARRHSHPGHCRLPAYVREREGRIERVHGPHLFPDAVAAGDKRAEPLYTVAFAASELWPGEGRVGDEVLLDLWESYLEAA